jgi:hypothetical protein
MRSVLGLSTCLLLTAALAACNKSEPATPAATTATSITAPALADAQAPAAPTPVAAPAAEDAAPVALTMDKIKSYLQAQVNLAHAAEANPKMGDPAQNVSEENVTQYAARLEADATMRAAIEKAGLSTRDFARIGDTLTGAMMTEAALKGGQLKKIPDGIDPASVQFVKQHDAEIKAMMAGMGAG